MNFSYGEYLNELMSELNLAMSEIMREREALFQLKRYGTLRDKVEFIIDRNERAMEDYNFLCVLYWTTFDRAESLDDLRAGRTPAESITRTRRAILEDRRKEEAESTFSLVLEALRSGVIY